MISHRCFNGYWPSEIDPAFAWYLFSDDAIAYLPLKYYLDESPITFNLLDVQRIAESGFPFYEETVANETDFAYCAFELTEEGRLSPKEEALRIFEKTKRAINFFIRARELPEAQRLAERENLLSSRTPDICYAMGAYLAECVLSDLLPEDSAECLLYAYFSTTEAEARTIEKKILKLGSLPEDTVFGGFFESEIGNTLIKYGISTLYELTMCDAARIQAIFPFQVNRFCSEIAPFLPDEMKDIAQGCDEILKTLAPKEEEILRMRRYGLSGLTLEETSERFNVTRQRVQQIETKAIRKLRHPIRHRVYFESLLPTFYAWFTERMDKYGLLSARAIEEALPSASAFTSFLVIFTTDKAVASFDYDSKIGVLYEAKTKLDGTFKTIAESMPEALSKEEFESLDDYLKNGLLLFRKYKMDDRGVYVRTGRRKRNEYLDLIQEVFPNGYKLYGEDDYQKLVAAWRQKYGATMKVPSRPAIRGAVGDKWQLVADGVYQPREKCPKLPEELLPSIYSYIE